MSSTVTLTDPAAAWKAPEDYVGSEHLCQINRMRLDNRPQGNPVYRVLSIRTS